MSSISLESLPEIQAFLATGMDPAYVVDREFNILWFNSAFRQMFGYRPRRGKQVCHEVAKMEICSGENCLLRSCLGAGSASRYVETSVAGAVVGETACSAIGFPVFDLAKNEIVAMLGVLRDISVEVRLHGKYHAMLEAERRQKEILERTVAERTADLVQANRNLQETNAALARSRQEVADILQNIGQAIMTIGPDLRIGREYSHFSETVFGTTDIAEQSVPEFLLHRPSQEPQRRAFAEWLKLVFNSPGLDWSTAVGTVQTDFQYYRADGQVRELAVGFEPIREENAIKRLMLVAEDVTEKSALKRSLSAREKEIEENIEHLAEIARLDPEVYEAFLEEGKQSIENALKQLQQLQQTPGDKELVTKVFRDMHTLKGNAMSFGLVRVAAKAHWVEDSFSALRRADAELVEATLAESLERVNELLSLFERIQNMAGRVLMQKTPDPGTVHEGKRANKVEVEPAVLQELVAWVRREIAEEAKAAELADRLNGLRLAKMQRLYGRFPAMVRDLAGQLGKNVNEIVLDGGDVMLDPTFLDRLAPVLVHLVRNSVDHGVEATPARLASGKPSFATVAIAARLGAEALELEVSDDGAGIDIARLVDKAIAAGLLPPGAAPSPPEALELIFADGLSTASAVTDVSGRGVGMSAVKAIVTELGGTLEIDTYPGCGTTFRLRFARTVALGAEAP